MAHMMWVEREKVHRAVVTYVSAEKPDQPQTLVYGPYLTKAACNTAIGRATRLLRNRHHHLWRGQTPLRVEHHIESSPLAWSKVEGT